MNVLKNEVIKTINGESEFTSQLINELILEKENKKAELQNLKDKIANRLEEKRLNEQEFLQIKKKIPKWKKEFEKANMDIKKMLLSEIIK